MSQDTLQILHKLSQDPEGSLAEIAKRLRSGSADRLLLQALAQMIDPNAKVNPFGVRLEARHTRAGAPRRPPNLELGRFIIDRIEAGEKLEAVVQDAKEKFGVSRSTAFNTLEAIRQSRDLTMKYWDLVAKDQESK